MHLSEQIPQRTISNSKHDVYYEGNKKNELNELKSYFKNTLSNPGLEMYRKEVIKKIIMYTTQGIDTSRFYPEMVIASGAKDIVQKKLVFLYLSIYSSHNADFARMAVNTFTKDADSPNPMFRALSIRHLSNLRFKGREQYVLPILKKGLDDFSPIVKKACLMGITKLITQQNRKQVQPVRDQELLNKLYGVLRDPDPHVVCSAIEAINEIEPEGIAMSKKLTHYLIKNLDNFNQMQLAQIVKYIELYDPKGEEQILQFLNCLDTKIKSQNLSLVLAICKIYLKYGKIQQSLMPQIQKKVKSCLLSFINLDSPQLSYVALKQILYIVKKYEIDIYVSQVKKFYLRENDPTYNKLIKIQLMHINCSKSNFGDIVNQFTQYLKDPIIIDAVMEAFNAIILKLELNQSKIIIKTLNDIVVNVSNKQYICNAAIKTIRTFLRKYPQEFRMFQHTFYTYARGVSQTSARCAMIQIIGDFGQQIQDAVELIVWSDSNISDELKISLLRANVKLFFKRPMQMLNIIINLFKQVLQDEETRMPVRDYATMLYRGLENDIQGFKKVFLACRSYSQGIKLPYNELQFNTLQTVYMKNSEQWLIDKTKYIQLLDQIEYNQQENGSFGEIGPGEDGLNQIDKIQKNRSMVDLSSQYTKIQPEDIVKEFTMTAQEFETCWESFEVGSSITRMVKQIQQLNQQTIQQLFRLWGIMSIASMQTQQSIKQYLYFKIEKGDIICMELTITKEVQTLGLIVKTENEELGGFVSKYVQDFLKINQIL